VIPHLRRLGPVGLVGSAAVALALGYESSWPARAGLLVAAAGILATVAMRSGRSPSVREFAIAPMLVALVVVAATAPLTAVSELLAGVGGVVAIVWVVEDPDRPPGGIARGATTIAIPGLAVGIAWSSALLLPGGSLSFGVTAALLALALAAIAVLLGRPDVFDREEVTSYGERG
jgi:hypothetical protein